MSFIGWSVFFFFFCFFWARSVLPAVGRVSRVWPLLQRLNLIKMSIRPSMPYTIDRCQRGWLRIRPNRWIIFQNPNGEDDDECQWIRWGANCGFDIGDIVPIFSTIFPLLETILVSNIFSQQGRYKSVLELFSQLIAVFSRALLANFNIFHVSWGGGMYWGWVLRTIFCRMNRTNGAWSIAISNAWK